MILNVFSFEHDIDFEISDVWSIHIENQKLFSQLVYNMCCLGSGIVTDEKISLSQDDKIYDCAKNMLVVQDIFNIPVNDKKIITSIANMINLELNDDLEMRRELDTYINGIYKLYLDKLIDYSIDCEMLKNISSVDILKLYGFKIIDNSTTLFEKLLLLVDIVSLTKSYKLIVLCNIKVYFNESEMIELYKYIRYNGLKVLVIEPRNYQVLEKEEKILYIDNDYIENVI